MKLGKRAIDGLTCPPDRRDRLVFDEDLAGFGLRVTRDGSKTFLFQYRRGQAVRRLRLGRYGDLTPAKARKLAEGLRGRVANGEDPAATRAAELAAEAEATRERRKRAQADVLTLRKLVQRWENIQLAHRSASYRQEATRALRSSLAGLMELPAAAIDAPMVRRALDAIPRQVKAKPPAGAAEAAALPAGQPAGGKIRGKGAPSVPVIRGETMARRVRAYGGALFGWAIKRGLVAANPFAGLSMEAREVQRDRVLNDAELAEVWRATGKLGWPLGHYLRFLLLTLQRQAETAALAWAELAPGFATWELPGEHTKNRKSHLVHLAGPARAILEAAPRLANSPLVFTTGGKLPLTGFAHAKSRLDAEIIAARVKLAAEAGDGCTPEPLVPWRLHDFRRTGVTVLARLGVRWEVADRLLNHVQGAIQGVARVYQRHDYLAEREAALDLWAAHVLAVGDGVAAGTNVIELRRGGAADAR